MTRWRTALLMALALSLPAAARAQGGAEAWRSEVDRLLDRWTDDPGSERLGRARNILKERVDVLSTDADAALDLARVELASGHADDALRVAERAAAQLAQREREVTAARRPEDPADELLELRERRIAALAVAFLADSRKRLEPVREVDEEKVRARMVEQAQALRARRAALLQVAGEEGAAVFLADEGARQVQLGTLDRIGHAARPLGAPDQDGLPIDLTAYRGEIVLVVFWTRDLADPSDLLVQIDKARADAGESKPLQVVSVCLDRDLAAARTWVAERGLGTWRHVFASDPDPRAESARTGLLSLDAAAWKVTSVPTGFLIDHRGRVRYVDPWEPSLSLAIRELAERRDQAQREADRRR